MKSDLRHRVLLRFNQIFLIKGFPFSFLDQHSFSVHNFDYIKGDLLDGFHAVEHCMELFNGFGVKGRVLGGRFPVSKAHNKFCQLFKIHLLEL